MKNIKRLNKLIEKCNRNYSTKWNEAMILPDLMENGFNPDDDDFSDFLEKLCINPIRKTTRMLPVFIASLVDTALSLESEILSCWKMKTDAPSSVIRKFRLITDLLTCEDKSLFNDFIDVL